MLLGILVTLLKLISSDLSSVRFSILGERYQSRLLFSRSIIVTCPPAQVTPYHQAPAQSCPVVHRLVLVFQLSPLVLLYNEISASHSLCGIVSMPIHIFDGNSTISAGAK